MLNATLIKKIDSQNSRSLPAKLRKKRMEIFFDFIKNIPAPVTILDVGGTETFWVAAGLAGNNNYRITILNLKEEKTHYPNLKSVEGDATGMKEFADNSFAVVFSNSVIEHVGDYEKQKNMAEEIRRIGKKYFVQTPNFYFPLEPHFIFPFFQFFPLALKSFLIRHFNLGWRKKIINREQSIKEAQSVKLLKEKKLKKLFPDAEIKKEKLFLLTKSFMIIKP